jgi:hypothetical protein
MIGGKKFSSLFFGFGVGGYGIAVTVEEVKIGEKLIVISLIVRQKLDNFQLDPPGFHRLAVT